MRRAAAYLALVLLVCVPRAEWTLCIAACGDVAIETTGACGNETLPSTESTCAPDHCTDCVDLTLSSGLTHAERYTYAPVIAVNACDVAGAAARPASAGALRQSPRVFPPPHLLRTTVIRC